MLISFQRGKGVVRTPRTSPHLPLPGYGCGFCNNTPSPHPRHLPSCYNVLPFPSDKIPFWIDLNRSLIVCYITKCWFCKFVRIGINWSWEWGGGPKIFSRLRVDEMGCYMYFCFAFLFSLLRGIGEGCFSLIHKICLKKMNQILNHFPLDPRQKDKGNNSIRLYRLPVYLATKNGVHLSIWRWIIIIIWQELFQN